MMETYEKYKKKVYRYLAPSLRHVHDFASFFGSVDPNPSIYKEDILMLVSSKENLSELQRYEAVNAFCCLDTGFSIRLFLVFCLAVYPYKDTAVGYEDFDWCYAFTLTTKAALIPRHWAGYYDDNPEGMEFCTNRSKEAYESYSIYMEEKYGEDETQHPIGDIDLWERSQGEKRQSFGIGSSDRHFILTGTPHLHQSGLHNQMLCLSNHNKRTEIYTRLLMDSGAL
ncbi:hypothetical protein E3N88_09611 [Mikania micrantha]|uniref:Uncharacterized protein n=1 Tax=Mikania micrantha TaxID=192012 RepID=A0A5N6PMM5_9ASTR|nr:hypothetical protein E3N88_09611 [Mikania micrantha]